MKIKKTVKTSMFVILSLLIILLFSTAWNFENVSAFDTIATLLSITTGFTITALSIIATSSFSKHLYSLEDPNNNAKTLLHNLIGKFKSSTIIFIVTIGLILVFKFMANPSDTLFYIKSYPISLTTLLKSIIWYMTIVSFISFFGLFETFARFVIKSATKQ